MNCRNKRKLLWIERYYPVDTRSDRMIATLLKSGQFDIRVCAWNRGEEVIPHPDTHYVLHTPIGYKRLLRKALAMPKYRQFVARQIRDFQPDVIACSFWDMAVLLATISGTKSYNIYDVIDLPGGSTILFRVARLMERLALPRFDKIILSSRFFEGWYKNTEAVTTVVENLPSLPQLVEEKSSGIEGLPIAFIGTVRHLETIIPAIKHTETTGRKFAIYGGGPDLPTLEEMYSESLTVDIHGGYQYFQLPKIYEQVLAVWAAYPVSEINVQFAISNKFFESIYFAVPGVFTSSSLLGQYVADNELGYCVDTTDQKDVAATIDSIVNDHQKLQKIKKNLENYRTEHPSHWRDIESKLVGVFEEEPSYRSRTR